ncbi:hypothetical protein P2H44_13030 [Albimonas sp. CAU 1670]|uniref:GH12 family glycosyl hydrolase domain-containing protein n=1 Tax=Albimonas sp. CAU 1670 TaxID=3032599 RepID=UPI0023DA2237|nr:hypothetical protein [Albimonas sp. CAU 1670]MDF2233477.1 hypothetical protein [Albimonas sp. CAU 1670]
MTGVLETDDAEAALGPVVAMNNTWGRRDLVAGRDYVQRIEHGETLADGLRMDWAWPEGDGRVLAFPELIVGRKPWGGVTGGDLLPLPLSATEGLSARWSVDWGGETDRFNLAFDLWIGSEAAGGPEAIRQEVMIWVKRGDFPSSGAAVGDHAQQGLSGPLFVDATHGNAPGESWGYIAWLPETGEGLREGELDLGALLSRLAAEGRIDADGWLTSVEFGPEITGGAGWLAITEFSVTLDGAAAGPADTGAEVLVPPPAPPAN